MAQYTFWCDIGRYPKYPTLVSLFLGSHHVTSPFYTFCVLREGFGSKGFLAFGSATEYLLSPTISGGEAVLPLRHLPAWKSDKSSHLSGWWFGVFFPISTIGIIHEWGNPTICLRTMAHAGCINALPPTTRWCWCPIVLRHPHGHLDRLSRRQTQPCRWHQSPLITNRGAQSRWRPQRHIPLTTSCPLQAWGRKVHERGRTIARKGWWHPCPCPLGRQCHRIPLTTLCPLWAWEGNILRWLVVCSCRQGEFYMVAKGWWCPCPLPQGWQGHHRAWPVFSCRLGLLPPTLYKQWGGALPWWHAVLWLRLTRHTPRLLPPLQINLLCYWRDWHTPFVSCQYHRGAKNQQLSEKLHWMPLCLPSSTGINDTPFIDTWHGKPGNALPPQQSSARNGASGLIAGLPTKPFNARSTSAYSCCVAVHRCTPCRFRVIAVPLRLQPTKPSTPRSSVIPSRIVVCCYHEGGGHDKTIFLVIARVEGIGPVLLIQEGGRCVCPWPSGLHKLWQLQIYLKLGSILLLLHARLAPPPLPPVFNKPTAFTLAGKIVASYLVSVVLINLGLVLMLPLRSGRLSWMPSIALQWYRRWAPFPLADLVLYLSSLRSQDVTTWPPLSSDWDTLQREYDTWLVLLTCHWE